MRPTTLAHGSAQGKQANTVGEKKRGTIRIENNQELSN